MTSAIDRYAHANSGYIENEIGRVRPMKFQCSAALSDSTLLCRPRASAVYRRRVLVTSAEALAFVQAHGVVLESGTGPVPALAAVIAGEPLRGSWWAHPRGREIFAVTRTIRDSTDVLVCRLIGGKITYVHRRLWPALVRLSERFPHSSLAQLREVHAASGKHEVEETPFPAWVSREVAAQASDLDEESALGQLGAWYRK
jgi:hypothetical protein